MGLFFCTRISIAISNPLYSLFKSVSLIKQNNMATKSIKVDSKTTLTFTVPEPQYKLVLSNGVTFVSNTLDVTKILAQYKALIAVKTVEVGVKWVIKKR